MATAQNRGKEWRTNAAGLTLVELMVVVAMTALLSALLLPALSTAKEKSRRAVCKSNIYQFFIAVKQYSDDDQDVLPSCADNKGYYHSIVLSDSGFSNLVELAGGNSNIFYCPNIVFGSSPGAVPQHIPNTGYVIGYSYLAASIYGSAKSPDYTVESVKWPSTATNELLADANYWTTPGSSSAGPFPALMKVAPHTSMGAAMAQSSSFTVGLPGLSSASIGAAGGNIGFIDGHVDWLTLPRMQTNSASSFDDAYGAW
jgi:prepilin-type processing-associated H-X9-DG protein